MDTDKGADGFSGISVTRNNQGQGVSKGVIVPDWPASVPKTAPTRIIKDFADLTAHRETC
jgi:hypothetical protein